MPNKKQRLARIPTLYAHYVHMHRVTGPIVMLSARGSPLAELFNDKRSCKELRPFIKLFMDASNQEFRDWSVFLMRKPEQIQREDNEFQDVLVETLWPGVFD